MSEAPTQVAPGVHRLGNAFINCYLIEDGNRMTLVDGGLPGFRGQLDDYLRSRGRTVADIDAVILTHAHSDHVGIVEGVRVDAPAPVYVHAADEQMARTGKTHRREGSMLPYLWRPAVWRFFASAVRAGGAKTTKVAELETFTEGDLDVPGRPRVIPTPGHSPGHVSFHLPDRGVLIAGDALCTYNVLTGERGPRLMPTRVRRRRAAGRRLARRARAHRRRRRAVRPRRAVDRRPGRGRRARPRARATMKARGRRLSWTPGARSRPRT